MTREEAINIMSQMIKDEDGFLSDNTVEAHKMAIEALKQAPRDDAISRQAVLKLFATNDGRYLYEAIRDLPTVASRQRTGLCKDCKYFEYDSVARLGNGIPIIVAHEICSKWGNGCKTRADGDCFMFESRESESDHIQS